ncbi:MAG: hypothetical protein AAF390_19470, partial [Pseudomonadota bacterium]
MRMDDIRFYLGRALRRLPILLAFVAVTGAAGAVAALRMPPSYGAEVQLVVESESIPGELAASTVRTRSQVHLELIRQRLLSRTSLLDLSHRLLIYGDDAPSPDAVVRDLRKRIGYAVIGEQASRRNSQPMTLVTLSFADPNAATATAVVNELAEMVLYEDVQMRTDGARDTLTFFEREVSRLQNALSRSDAELLAFKRENPAVLDGAAEVRRARLGYLETEMDRLATEMESMGAQRDRLTRVHETTRLYEAQARGFTPSLEKGRIEALRISLADLPPGDPGAADLTDRIDALANFLDGQTPSALPAVGRTAYHDRMDDLAARIAAAEARGGELTAEMAAIRTELSAAPEKGVRFAALLRDHRILQDQLDDALAARSAAETGDTIEALSKGKRIALVEPANSARDLSGPERKRIGILALAIGIL